MMANKTDAKPTPEKSKAFEYTKRQLAEAKAFENIRDVVDAVLEDGKTYTMDQANGLISEFMKRKVT
jgi:hypothetical protein